MKGSYEKPIVRSDLPPVMVMPHRNATLIVGHCMHPTIKHNSLVGFDPGDKELVAGHIYIFKIPDANPQWQVKRFLKWIVPDQNVLLGTDNPHYMDLVHDLRHIEIVGKVKWIDNESLLASLHNKDSVSNKKNIQNPADSTRPQRLTMPELRKFGVFLVKRKPYAILICNDCNSRWGFVREKGEKPPDGYWHCPNRCNIEH